VALSLGSFAQFSLFARHLGFFAPFLDIGLLWLVTQVRGVLFDWLDRKLGAGAHGTAEADPYRAGSFSLTPEQAPHTFLFSVVVTLER